MFEPLEEPLHRYLKASLVVNTKSEEPVGDAITNRLVNYMRECRSNSVKDADPALRQAWLTWRDESTCSLRWSIEALAAAGETSSSISEVLGVSKDWVQLYLDCFFDMADSGIRERYIKNIHRRLKAFTTLNMPDLGWKHIAIFGGVARFIRLVIDRTKATAADLKWLSEDCDKLKSLMIWGRSWEALNSGVAASEDRIRVEQFVMTHAGSKADTKESNNDSLIVKLLSGIGETKPVKMETREAKEFGAAE